MNRLDSSWGTTPPWLKQPSLVTSKCKNLLQSEQAAYTNVIDDVKTSSCRPCLCVYIVVCDSRESWTNCDSECVVVCNYDRTKINEKYKNPCLKGKIVYMCKNVVCNIGFEVNSPMNLPPFLPCG